MKNRYSFLVIFQFALILSLFLILPKNIDKTILNIFAKPIQIQINKKIPNTLKIVLPNDIAIGDFIDFITKSKQPPNMNNQIYSVAIQRLKDPILIDQTKNIKVLNFLSHQNLNEIRNYKLFEIIKVNYPLIIMNIIILIAISFILLPKPFNKLDSSLKKVYGYILILGILFELLFINILYFGVFLSYCILRLLWKKNFINYLFIFLLIGLSLYLIINNKTSFGTGILSLIIFKCFSYYFLPKHRLELES